ncbi:amidohydrolase [Chitinophaga sp. SYP-B3965]|uniref:M20 metallopeptidase family protein n=1 Tax=Chitinophaga sp. SYP-B3965 TaxID=2663120 RepID=UPI00129977EB|nr:M20 family metallopeptidase [Chitinophaga sp. SYP-B3965]MRG48332.1 amidohydrolase [Chitinophaga sp. SYP-B3965]
MLLEEIKKLSASIFPEVIKDRRHLHANPELSFHEHETCAYVKKALSDLGIEWTPVAETGVLALIKGELPSEKVVALRADMDALPITESNELPYVSLQKGVMHACGHDAHTASLLGTAKILQSLKHLFGGTVKLLFQPGEEKLPGGATLMIRDGVLQNPAPVAVVGQHVMPSIPVGKIGIRKGKFMASMDEITLHIYGRGGHGAQPHLNIDPVAIASQVIVSLQQIVSRAANPSTPSVLSFGRFIADGAVNVIPDSVYIEGTFRTMNEEWREEAHQRIRKIIEGIVEAMGGTCQLNIRKGYPALVNEETLTTNVITYIEEYAGKENIIDLDIWMASEDFAYYGRELPACFYLLGVGNVERNITASLHTPGFNIDEDALRLSPGLMAYIAIKALA